MPKIYTHLTTQERAVLMTMRDDQCGIRSMAKRLGRVPSSISRELRRAPGDGDRIEQIAARQGVPLARSTLGEWIGRIGVALQPLADRLAELLKERSCLHADETPVRQLDPGSGKTRHAYLWAYRSNALDDGPSVVVFDYQTSRAGAHARAFLQDWRGHLMVDDYAGYKALFTAGPIELACLAHIRRKIFDVHAASGSPVAEEALRRIAQLYAIEQQASAMASAQRLALREQHAIPALATMQAWLLTTQRSVAAGSGTAKAIEHALKRWPALQRYASSGSLPIDNNPVENAIRPIAIGKKNWLFAGSERAGRRAAAIQSLFATANSMDSIRRAGWPTLLKNSQPARTAESTAATVRKLYTVL